MLGFSVVFVLLGWRCPARLGGWLVDLAQRSSSVVLGVITILLGLAFAGLVPFLQRDWRVHKVPAVGLAAAPLLGFLFGVGWTPCIGPTLPRSPSLSLNEAHRRPRRAARPASTRSGSGCRSSSRPRLPAHAGRVRVVRRHQLWVTRLGGLMLVLVGLLLVTGWWDQAVTWLQIQPGRAAPRLAL